MTAAVTRTQRSNTTRDLHICQFISGHITSHILHLNATISSDYSAIKGKSSWDFFLLGWSLHSKINHFTNLADLDICLKESFYGCFHFSWDLWWSGILNQVECSFSTLQQAQHVNVRFLHAVKKETDRWVSLRCCRVIRLQIGDHQFILGSILVLMMGEFVAVCRICLCACVCVCVEGEGRWEIVN